MTKFLTQAQLDHFNQYGYVLPIRESLEGYEHESGGPRKAWQRHKTHLLFLGLKKLVRQERTIDAIEDLYGYNVLCWTTNFFIKETCDAAYVSQHQDSNYRRLSKPDLVTACVVLSDSKEFNDAMQIVQGTLLSVKIFHKNTFSKDNLLTRRQEVELNIDPAKAVSINLHPA